MADNRFFPLAAARHNLKRLLLIRIIVLACQFSALIYAWFILGLELAYGVIGSILSLIVAVNIWVVFRVRQNTVISNREFFGHLLFDVLALSTLIYLTGGANNPFVSFLLVPITISAAILPWTYTWFMAAISLLLYTLLLFYYQPLPALMPAEMHGAGGTAMPSLHIVGMWFNFLASAALITYFVVKMATEIRAQEDSLNHYREENLRNEQILAVATQAAGTAHELGTPLNTMTLLVNEMAEDNPGNTALQKDIALLKTQLHTCRQSLKDLVSKADPRQTGTVRPVKITTLVDQIHEQWRLLRPEVDLSVGISGAGQSPEVKADATLQQAIVNLLNNAADASPDKIELDVNWTPEAWILSIHDFGAGISEEIGPFLGTEIISGKEYGMGVGMILSQATISRLGGKVTIFPHPEAGTITRVVLPLLPGE